MKLAKTELGEEEIRRILANFVKNRIGPRLNLAKTEIGEDAIWRKPNMANLRK